MPGERERDRIVPFPSKLAFGVGQAAEGLKNTGFALFVLFYYNQVLGLPGSLAGLALAIALIFDAITDPLAGSLSDNWKSRLGRRHPFMYASAIPLALAFVGLFSPPQELGEWGLFLWLSLFAILTRAAMTLYHVPHLALGAEMTENFEERTRIVAFRQFFAAVGSAGAMILGFGWFFADANGGRLAVENYTPYALTLAVFMVVTVIYSAYGTRREIPFLMDPPAKPKRNPFTQLALDLREGLTNRSFRWLFAGVLIVFVMAGVNSALDLYMYQYFWELSGGHMLVLSLTTVVGLVLGVFLTPTLLRLTDKRFGLILGTAAWAIFQVAPVMLRLVGWFPENGEPALLAALIGAKFVQGLILQQAFIAFGSMMADVADEHELESGLRQEGIFFGAISFSGKATSGFGTLIAGIGLDIIRWPRGPDIQTAADVPADTIVSLGVLYGPVVAAFAVVSLWCYSHYNLSRTRHAEVLDALNELRAGRRAEAAVEGGEVSAAAPR